MNKKISILISVAFGLGSLIIVILLGLTIMSNMNDRINSACESIEYEGIYSFDDGDINCTQLWEIKYVDGQWSKECSVFPLSNRIS